MELRDHHIEFIREDLVSKGITMEDLNESLVDHICCMLESVGEEDFEITYNEVICSFGKNSLLTIQLETLALLTLKNRIIMKKAMFIIGYFSVLFISTGVVFKMLHLPGAMIILLLGIVFLNVGFLPLYFYDRYKKSIAEM